ncbi:MAG: hypothetical protein AAF525_16835 [Pseudomonadota bacterium]
MEGIQQRAIQGLWAFVLVVTCHWVHAALPVAPATCDYGKVHPNAPKEIAQFDFLVGDYQVTMHQWLGKQWSPPQPGVTARWNGYYGLDGMAIVDEWFHPDPAQKPDSSRGINVRMYDTQSDIWKMMWVATGAFTVQDLRAEVRDGVLTMWQVYPDRANFKATFHVDDADNWHRVSYTQDKDGEWVEQFMLKATRISCEAS